MIRSYLQKRKDRKTLEKMVSPEAAAGILRGDPPEGPPFTAGRIEFVLVYVAGNTPEEISEHVGSVTEMATSHDGIVASIIGALVVIVFGTRPHKSPANELRIALVGQMNQALSSHMKIVHGVSDGHCGIVGGGTLAYYTFILPGFDAILGRLSRLEFGQVEEFLT